MWQRGCLEKRREEKRRRKGVEVAKDGIPSMPCAT